MKTTFKDKNGNRIQEPGNMFFKIPDELEENGFCEFQAPVKIFQGMLGWYCRHEKRVIPFRDHYKDGNVHDAVFKGY